LAKQDLLALLRTELSRAGDPKKTAAMQAYMKSAMPYWGVQTPVQRDITRRLFTANRLETAEEWREACLKIWRAAEYREERYAAIELTGFKYYRECRRSIRCRCTKS
jgi:3-methyladenine DNA glycosylase AlkD